MCCRLELRPSSRPHHLLLPAPGGQVEVTRGTGGLAAWVATVSPHQKEGGIKRFRSNKLFSPHHETLRLTVYKKLGQSTHASGAPLPGSEPLCSGRISQASRPPAPGCSPEPRGGPKGTHLLIRPACSCWRSRGGAVGGRCSSPGRQRPPRGRAPPLPSCPPACEAPVPDRWVSVARCAAPWWLRIRSTVEI